MGCLSATRVAEIQAQITKLEARLLKLETAYSEAATAIESYKLDTGQSAGSQSAKRRSLDELQEAIDSIESRLEHLRAKLRGTGIINTVLRRK